MRREVAPCIAWPRAPVDLPDQHLGLADELAASRAATLGIRARRDWDAIAALGFDGVWLMGVWQRSPAGIAIALRTRACAPSSERALPDLRADDVVGSPYCVRGYVVDEHFGGRGGLARRATRSPARGLRLILDFVPNHVAPDHPWATEHPEYFVPGSAEDLERDPASFVETWRASPRPRARSVLSRPGPTSLQLNASSRPCARP